MCVCVFLGLEIPDLPSRTSRWIRCLSTAMAQRWKLAILKASTVTRLSLRRVRFSRVAARTTLFEKRRACSKFI